MDYSIRNVGKSVDSTKINFPYFLDNTKLNLTIEMVKSLMQLTSCW